MIRARLEFEAIIKIQIKIRRWLVRRQHERMQKNDRRGQKKKGKKRQQAMPRNNAVNQRAAAMGMGTIAKVPKQRFWQQSMSSTNKSMQKQQNSSTAGIKQSQHGPSQATGSPDLRDPQPA